MEEIALELRNAYETGGIRQSGLNLKCWGPQQDNIGTWLFNEQAIFQTNTYLSFLKYDNKTQ